MSLSFQTKLILAIGLFAAAISSISSYLFYETIQRNVWSQTSERLKDVGRAGQFLLTVEDRKAIRTLDDLSNQMALPRTQELLAGIRPGQNVSNLSEQSRQELEKRQDYRRLVQIMRRIKHSTRRAIARPGLDIAQPIDPADPPLLRYSYILVPIAESPNHTILKFIVDGDDQRLDTNGDGKIEDDEEPTSIGMLYNVSGQPRMLEALRNGMATASDQYYRDQWGVWLSAYIPILDQEGRTFAILGVDLSAESEFSLVNHLQRMLLAIVLSSVFVAALLGLLIARLLSRPLLDLGRAVERVKRRDFTVRLPPRTGDEFGQLAEAFNSMVAEIESYTLHMEDIVLRRTTELRSRMETLQDVRKPDSADPFVRSVLAAPVMGQLLDSQTVLDMAVGESVEQVRTVSIFRSFTLGGQGYVFFFLASLAGDSLRLAEKSLLLTVSINARLLLQSGGQQEPGAWLQSLHHYTEALLKEFPDIEVSRLMGLFQKRTGLLYSNDSGCPALLFRQNKSIPVKTGRSEESTVTQLEVGDQYFATPCDAQNAAESGASSLNAGSHIARKAFAEIVEENRGQLHLIRDTLAAQFAFLGGVLRLTFLERNQSVGSPMDPMEEVEKLLRLKEYSTALALLRKLDDGDFFKHYYSGICYSRQGDHARALESLQFARNLLEQRANAVHSLALWLEERGEAVLASRLQEKALLMRPEGAGN
ncbi:MAG: HAMP domain-containing protein [Leptospiraceae bacterium]|nr:HAMP domain-containing protein [Leptospiraceae bacterium]